VGPVAIAKFATIVIPALSLISYYQT